MTTTAIKPKQTNDFSQSFFNTVFSQPGAVHRCISHTSVHPEHYRVMLYTGSSLPMITVLDYYEDHVDISFYGYKQSTAKLDGPIHKYVTPNNDLYYLEGEALYSEIYTLEYNDKNSSQYYLDYKPILNISAMLLKDEPLPGLVDKPRMFFNDRYNTEFLKTFIDFQEITYNDFVSCIDHDDYMVLLGKNNALYVIELRTEEGLRITVSEFIPGKEPKYHTYPQYNDKSTTLLNTISTLSNKLSNDIRTYIGRWNEIEDTSSNDIEDVVIQDWEDEPNRQRIPASERRKASKKASSEEIDDLKRRIDKCFEYLKDSRITKKEFTRVMLEAWSNHSLNLCYLAIEAAKKAESIGEDDESWG